MQDAGDVFAAICGAGRSLGFVCAPSLLQLTVGVCDGTPPDLTAYDANRTLLYDSLTAMGYDAVRPDGAFYLFVKALEEDAYAFCERAKKYELLLVPSDSFGVSGYVRIAYCVSNEQIRRSLPAFEALYNDYCKE
jgi:aspartate aminotransferase